MDKLRGKVWGWMCVVVMLGVAGCDVEGKTEKAAKTDPKPLFMLSNEGVGPLNPATPFNLVKIGDAFQNFNVAQETSLTSANQTPTITVRQQVKPILSINPDHKQERIFSVVVQDNLVGNQLGNKIGDKFNEIYKTGSTEECAPALEEWAGKIMCYAPKSSNILYLFSGQWNGAKDQMPPLDVLANWQLEAMIWKAPKEPS